MCFLYTGVSSDVPKGLVSWVIMLLFENLIRIFYLFSMVMDSFIFCYMGVYCPVEIVCVYRLFFFLWGILSAESGLHWKVCFVLLLKPIVMQCYFKMISAMTVILAMIHTSHKHTTTTSQNKIITTTTKAFNV